MSQHKISPPKYKPGNCSECMRYLLIGNCNDKCERAPAHKKPENDQERMSNIRTFIKKCNASYKNNKKPGDQDFD